MNLFHFQYRNRLALMAEGVLDSAEAARVRDHAASCAACGAELAWLSQVVNFLQADASVDRPLPISSGALLTRGRAQIRSSSGEEAAPGPRFAPFPAALGLVAAGALIGAVTARFSPAPRAEPARMAADLPGRETSAGDVAFYERLEKSQARASAARYLTEAQDVLVQVTAAAADCPDSPKDRVDVTREAETSRSLLKRRAALVAGSPEGFASARGVMEEVEGLLQQVADLPQCTRRTEVDAIARSVDKKKLLMKIDLIAQELVTS